MKLTADMIEGLAGVYLAERYDNPAPTPEFHRECWARYCSDVPACATAAPRNGAKSTALTHVYAIANVLLRIEQYIIILSASEELAIEHLGDIAAEFRENEALIAHFKIRKFIADQKTDVVVECEDGYQFRLIARGAEQKIRGRKWRGRRPGLIICDDLEDDEQILNRDRRKKFRQWFFRAVKQALRDGGKIRVHGTILHSDSLLAHLIKNPTWAGRCYRAHRGFDDFTELLWPEKFPEARLRAIRDEMVAEGDSAGYAQEYLNDPRDDEHAYLKSDDFLPMSEEDAELFKLYYVGCDFAISKRDVANRTALTVGGRDATNRLHIVDVRCDRYDALEIIEELFSIQQRYTPEAFFVEKGQIWAALEPMLRNEMLKRDIYLNVVPLASTRDKAARGSSFQKRMRAGAVRFNRQADWYLDYEDELLSFSAGSEAIRDDQFDSTTILVRGIEEMPKVEDEDALTEEEQEFERQVRFARPQTGRSSVTGY